LALLGSDPKLAFETDYKDAGEDEQKKNTLAHRIVCAALEGMNKRYNSLSRMDDWEQLYKHLSDMLSKKIAKERSSGVPEDLIGKPFLRFIQGATGKPVEIRKAVWVLINAISPIRISFLDGQRRATGSMYSLINCCPETSMDALVKQRQLEVRDKGVEEDDEEDKDEESDDEDEESDDEDEESDDQEGGGRGKRQYLVYLEWPDIEKNLSTDVSVVSVQMTGELSTHISAREMKILQSHSNRVQIEPTAGRPRNLQDALTTILQHYPRNLLVPGELSSNDKEETEETEEKRNIKVFITSRDHVLKKFFDESGAAISDMIKDAITNMRAKGELEKMDPAQQIPAFLTKNREAWEVAKRDHLNFSTRPFKVRRELNEIAFTIACFVFSKDSRNLFQYLLTMTEGTVASNDEFVPLLESEGARTQNGNQLMGTLGVQGKTYGVSDWQYPDSLTSSIVQENPDRDVGISCREEMISLLWV
jgi:hypothetical protein